MAETLESIWVNVGNQQVHAYAAGKSGSPVVLLHGGGLDSATLSWGETIPVLATSHRVYACDWPGYGESPLGELKVSMQTYIDFFPRLLDALALPQASLVGLSMGGGIALGFALQYPQRVNKLTLVSSYGFQRLVAYHRLSYWFVKMSWMTPLTYAFLKRSRWLTKQSLASIVARPASLTPEMLDEVFRLVQKPGIGKSFQLLQQDEVQPQGLKTVFLDRVGELKMPVLLVQGEKDSLVALHWAQEAKQLNSAFRLEVLENCGHWLQRDAPVEFHRLLAEFL